jgi:hypothetical protein
MRPRTAGGGQLQRGSVAHANARANAHANAARDARDARDATICETPRPGQPQIAAELQVVAFEGEAVGHDARVALRPEYRKSVTGSHERERREGEREAGETGERERERAREKARAA